MESLSVASNFELSSAVVGQVMSLVRSSLSLLALSGCKYMLRSSSHLLAGLPCGNLFDWLILLGSTWRQAWSNSVRGAWQSSLPASKEIWLCLRIHDVILLAANKSSDLRVALFL